MGVRVGVANLALWALEWAWKIFLALWALEWAWQIWTFFAGVRVGVANFFLGQSIGIDENNTFRYKFLL